MRIQTIAFVILLLQTLSGYSQQNPITDTWRNIERSLRSKNNLEATRNRLLQLKREAIENKDQASLARAYCYLMLLQDQKTEDTLYFRNSAFIDSILLSPADNELKCIFHYLQAQRLWKHLRKYIQDDLKFNRTLYETKNLPYNYASFSHNVLDSLINFHFEKAADIAMYLKKTGKEPPIDKIIWLSSTPLSFLWKPSLVDIIYKEHISYHVSESESYFDKKRARHWFDLSPDAFVDTLRELSRYKKPEWNVLYLYSEWLEKIAPKNNVYYSIEFAARRYVYGELESDNEKDLPVQKAWESYLISLSQSPSQELQAIGIFHRCFLYKHWAERYAPSYGYMSQPSKAYDTTFQYYNVKALQLYGKHKALFDRFPTLKEQLDDLQDLRDPYALVKMNYENAPSVPILLRLEYKNLQTFYYRIVRINLNENFDKKLLPAVWLLQKPLLRQQAVTLPLPADYNLHRTFLTLDSLPAGRYCLLFSNDSSFQTSTVSFQNFLVSGLAVLHTDNRVYVVNRTSGLPVANAAVNASCIVETGSGKNIIRHTLHHNYTTNIEGFVVLPDKKEDYNLLVSHKGDSLKESADVKETEVSDDVYDKDDYDDLVDFYDENTTVEIFTDRSIYRPGQKVFFKALFITKNPKTGESEIMNKSNLKKGFRNWLKKWIKDVEPGLVLFDPFSRMMDSFYILPDAYGTVSGAFTLPKNAATGQWQIRPDYLETGHNSGSFQVEEYKRPTYEVTALPPDKIYRLGDTLFFTLKLKSFAGAMLGHTLVRYNIERVYSARAGGDGGYSNIQITDTSAYTDERGQLLIMLRDTSLQEVNTLKDVTYRLYASATDATGETHLASSSLRVAARPVLIRIPLYGNTNKKDLRPLLINAKDVNEREINRTLQARLYRISMPAKIFDNNYTGFADQWKYDSKELEGRFGYIQFMPTNEKEREDLIFETTIHTANADKFRWPLDKVTTGRYRLEVTCTEDGVITGEASKTISIFEPGSHLLPIPKEQFFHLEANFLKKGDTLRLFSGSGLDIAFRIIQLKYYALRHGKKTVVNRFFSGVQQAGIREWTWKLPVDIVDRLLITEVYVARGKVFHEQEEVDIAAGAFSPQVIIEQFRSTLTPGAQTTYAVSVKTKDEHTAAQLMTTIYDASLDRLKKHSWDIPYPERSRYLRSDWPGSITDEVDKLSTFFEPKPSKTFSQKPLWWLEATGLSGGATTIISQNPLLQLQGRVPGLMITNATGLDGELGTIAYGTTTRRFSTGNVSRVKVQGLNSINLNDYKQPLVMLDGVPYTGDLSSLNTKEITEIMVLKDADATAIYGSRAAEGVLLISTKGPIKLPVVKQEPVLKVRKDFNETAFFAPAIYADKEGFYRFTFRPSESLTEWNWKILAHTKNMKFTYAERKLVTQLPLMIQPHLPTIMYQGDRIILKSRISNLDTTKLAGKAMCKIEDAVTGTDLTAGMVLRPEMAFEVGGQLNTTASFELNIPDFLMHPVKILLTAKTDAFADGEEHEIPILSKQILVKQNQQMYLLKKDTSIIPPASINRLYGMELSLAQQPQAALLYSLPFLANYSYSCAEQTFNKMYAWFTALTIMRKDSIVRSLYAKAVTGGHEKVMRDVTPLSQETMPWLQLDDKVHKEQSELLEMLDTLVCRRKIHDYLSKLMLCQQDDGGISWFPGGHSSPDVSFYLLARMGKMYRNEGWKLKDYTEYNMEDFLRKLIAYCDDTFLLYDDVPFKPFIYRCYARIFWKQLYPLSGGLVSKFNRRLAQGWQMADNINLKEQALLCLATLRYCHQSDSLYKKAIEAIGSIKQRAIQDTVNGTRWKELADAEDIGSTSEETLAYLLETFQEAGEAAGMEPGIIQWLLHAKNDYQWKTTTGTAAVISMLQRSRQSVVDNINDLNVQLQGADWLVSDGLLSGNRVAFHQTVPQPVPFLVHRLSESPAMATFAWYYFTDRPDSIKSEVKIHKAIAHMNEATKEWENVADNKLKPGEEVQITLTIETQRKLSYVFINDNKAAAFEPQEYESGYIWGNRFSYYEMVQDAGRHFFAESIPAGKTKFIYRMLVAQEGRFSSGRAILKCMYHPETEAYSNQQYIDVGKQ
jgi:TonB-dependent SusC/RagA subfamily outer membrane receptor